MLLLTHLLATVYLKGSLLARVRQRHPMARPPARTPKLRIVKWSFFPFLLSIFFYLFPSFSSSDGGSGGKRALVCIVPRPCIDVLCC